MSQDQTGLVLLSGRSEPRLGGSPEPAGPEPEAEAEPRPTPLLPRAERLRLSRDRHREPRTEKRQILRVVSSPNGRWIVVLTCAKPDGRRAAGRQGLNRSFKMELWYGSFCLTFGEAIEVLSPPRSPPGPIMIPHLNSWDSYKTVHSPVLQFSMFFPPQNKPWTDFRK